MKKVLLIFPIFFIFLFGCTINEENMGVISVDADYVIDFMEKDGVMFLYVGSDSSVSCQEFQKILEEILKESPEKTVHYFNVDVEAERDEEKTERVLLELDTLLVPALLKIENGVVIDEILGIREETREDILELIEEEFS